MALVAVIPVSSWLCAVTATLRFQVTVPVLLQLLDKKKKRLDDVVDEQLPSSSRMDKFIMGLLPPWQQTMLMAMQPSSTLASLNDEGCDNNNNDYESQSSATTILIDSDIIDQLKDYSNDNDISSKAAAAIMSGNENESSIPIMEIIASNDESKSSLTMPSSFAKVGTNNALSKEVHEKSTPYKDTSGMMPEGGEIAHDDWSSSSSGETIQLEVVGDEADSSSSKVEDKDALLQEREEDAQHDADNNQAFYSVKADIMLAESLLDKDKDIKDANNNNDDVTTSLPQEEEGVEVEVATDRLSKDTASEQHQQKQVEAADEEVIVGDGLDNHDHESSSSVATIIESTNKPTLQSEYTPSQKTSLTTSKENNVEDISSSIISKGVTVAEPSLLSFTPLSIHKLTHGTTIILFVSTSLSIIYSLAVHIFLSSFHERSFYKKKHLTPVAVRVLVALAIWGAHWVSLRLCYGIISVSSNKNVVDHNTTNTAQQYHDDWTCCHDEESSIIMSSSSPTSSVLVFTIVEIFIAMAATIISIKLIRHTRHEEVNGPEPPFISMKGRVVFITGANAGIGLETARQLYHRGATVLLGCRSRSRALDAMREIAESVSHHDNREKTATTCPKNKMHFIQLDLTCLSSIHEAVHAFHGMDLPLHALINNAGVMRNKREETVDGLEMTMAANHLGHFLLTNLLLPKLRETAIEEGRPSRVITVSSSLYCRSHRRCRGDGTRRGKLEPGIDVSDLQCQQKKYSLFEQYAQSKLANILFSLELGRRERSNIMEQQQPLPAQKNQSIPVRKREKTILTPVEKNPSSDEIDEVGLGSNNIVPSPALTLAAGRRKKKIRPSLTSSTNRLDIEASFGEVAVAPSKADKKGRRRLKPTSPSKVAREVDNDEVGLGFNDIVSTSMPKRKDRPKLLPIVPSTVVADEEKKDDESSLGFENIAHPPLTKKKSRPKLMPSKVAEEEDDETGLGFHDIVFTSPTLKQRKDSPKPMPMLSKAIKEDDKTSDVELASFCPIKSYCLHPGLVRTNVVRDMPWYLYYPNVIFSVFMAMLQKSPRSGAYTSVHCVLMDATKNVDDECYFVNSELQPLDNLALIKDDAEQLWEMSRKLVSIH